MALKKDSLINMATLVKLLDQMNDLRSKINDIEKTMLDSTALLEEGLEKVQKTEQKRSSGLGGTGGGLFGEKTFGSKGETFGC